MLPLFFLQALPVAASGPSDENPNSTIEFTQIEFPDVREGYVSLGWNVVAGADEYVVTDSEGDVPYRGAFEQAFVSGLSDGDYRYTVQALDSQGNIIAESLVPARVQVNHWPLWQSLILFAIGLIVFLIIITLIAMGALHDRAQQSGSPKFAGEPE